MSSKSSFVEKDAEKFALVSRNFQIPSTDHIFLNEAFRRFYFWHFSVADQV